VSTSTPSTRRLLDGVPKFIWFWARHPALWVGMIVLLTLKAFHIRKRFVAKHKNIKI